MKSCQIATLVNANLGEGNNNYHSDVKKNTVQIKKLAEKNATTRNENGLKRTISFL